MKPEKAISIINDYDVYFEGHTAEEIVDAIELAIEALQKQIPKPVEETHVLCTETHAVRSDTISRQVAIDALDVLCQEHRYKIPGKGETYSQYNEAWQDALGRAESVIGNLPSAQPQWIRIEDRCPKPDVLVLVSTKGEVDADWIAKDSSGYGCWYRSMRGVNDIDAWMPLPEPYKGGE